MPGYYSAQGTTVEFDGVSIGYLTGFDWDASAGLEETTGISNTVVGTGAEARVVKSYTATTVEPVKISIRFHGPPSFAASDAGLVATLEFNGPGVTLTGQACLISFSHAGRPNQWTEGSAVFQFTG